MPAGGRPTSERVRVDTMPKQKRDLNAIYISERLQESLRPILRCALTTVVAPMGYGKTTAVNWYLEERAKAGPLRVVRIKIGRASCRERVLAMV